VILGLLPDFTIVADQFKEYQAPQTAPAHYTAATL